jgi:hypothetical protein
MRAARTLPWVGALAAASVVLAGCGSSQPAGGAAARPAAAELAGALFADARYEADGDALFRARRALVRRCMAGRGFAFHADDGALPPPPRTTLPRTRDGYGMYARLAAVRPSVRRAATDQSRSANGRYVHSLPTRRRAAYERALDGSPQRRATMRVAGTPPFRYATDGCYAAAVARVEGSLKAYYGRLAVQNVAAAVVDRSLERDAALKRSLAGWRRCMRTHGYRSGSPGDARDAVYAAYIRARRLERVRPRERKTAAADRACGLRSGFYRAQDAARARAVRALPARQARALQAGARARAAAARRARTLLSRRAA